MTSNSRRLLIRKSKTFQKTSVPCAFEIFPPTAPKVDTLRLKWTQLFAARLEDLARNAERTEAKEGKSLPYASLRLLIQARCHAATFVSHDLGAPWKRKDGRAEHVILEGTTDADFVKQIESCLQVWSETYLHEWAERLGLADALVDDIQAAIREGDAIESEIVKTEGENSYILSKDSFDRVASAILQTASQRISGQEIFEGLGPVYKLARAHYRRRDIEFETWPAEAKGALYSMTLQLSVESQPFSKLPIVTVRASRRRWAMEAPDYVRASSVEAHMLNRMGPFIAITFPLQVRRGKLQDPADTQHTMLALEWGADIGATLSDMVHQSIPTTNVFIGIPHSNSYRPPHPIGPGASNQDLYDALLKIKHLMRNDGWDDVPERVVKSPGKRFADMFRLVDLEDQLIDFALANGRNDVSAEGLTEALDDFLKLTDNSRLSISRLPKDQNKLENVRQTNKQKVARAYEGVKPNLVVIAREEKERDRLCQSIERLFGDALALHQIPLPPGVHGPVDLLQEGGKRLSPQQRFDKRVEAWAPALESLRTIGNDCHIIVQADEYYGTKKDDPVSKLAGRHALAAKGRANVQYLLPMEEKRRNGIPNYLIRAQMAVYDVLFGHTGLISDVKDVVAEAFPDEANRPGSIIGISVVSQSRSRIIGGGGGRICLATKLDVQKGLTTGKIGYWDKNAKMGCWDSAWIPFHDLLKQVAGLSEIRKLGDTKEAEQQTYQQFVESVLEDAQSVPGGSLVMFDSTTAAAALWHWLRDTDLAGNNIVIADPTRNHSARWPNVRLVRIRPNITPPIISYKSALYAEVDPVTGEESPETESVGYATVIPQILQMTADENGNKNFWVTSGFSKTVQVPRGLSVYRNVQKLVGAEEEIDPKTVSVRLDGLKTLTTRTPYVDGYRSPNSIEITIAKSCDGDDQDLIASLIHQLRYGYGHTDDETVLPAPLFFENKVRDYMVRFDIAGLTDDEQPEDISLPADNLQAAAEVRLATAEPAEAAAQNLSARVDERRRKYEISADETPTVVNSGAAPAHSNEEEADLADAEAVSPLDLRLPLMPLPGFVTLEWIGQVMSTTPKLRRTIFEKRNWISEITGFADWTEAIPSEDQFNRIMLRGLRYPLFLWTVNTTGATQWPTWHRKASRFAIFNNLRLRYQTALGVALRSSPDKSVGTVGDGIRLLIKTHSAHDERLIVESTFAFEATLGAEPHLAQVVEENAELFAELTQFHRASKLFLSLQPKDLALKVLRDAGASKQAVKETEETASTNSISAGEDHDSDEETQDVAEITPVAESEGVHETEIDQRDLAVERKVVEKAAALSRGDLEHSWREALQVLANEAFSAASQSPNANVIDKIGLYLKKAADVSHVWSMLGPAAADASPYTRFALEAYEELNQLCSRYQGLTLITHEDKNRLDNCVTSAGSVSEIDPEGEPGIQEYRDVLLGRREAVRLHAAAFDQLRRDVAERPEKVDAMLEERKSLLFALDGLVPALISFCVMITESSAEHIWAPAPPPAVSAPAADDQTGRASPSAQERLDPPAFMGEEPTIEVGDEDDPLEDISALTAVIAEIASDTAEPAAPSEADAQDNPYVNIVADRIRRLIRQGSYSLAYHLTLAAERLFSSDLPITPEEVRLIAIAGHVNHSAGHASTIVQSLTERAYAELSILDDDSDFGIARRLYAFGASVEHALLGRQSSSSHLVQQITMDHAFNEDVYPLKEELGTATHMDISLTIPLFSTLRPQKVAKDSGVEKKRSAVAKAKAVARLHFDFALARKVLNHMSRREGVLGSLIAALDTGDGLEAAKAFSTEWGDRSSIILQLNRTESEVNSRVQGIDGAARERFVSNLLELSDLCSEYTESQEVLPYVAGGSGRTNLSTFAERLRTSAERALKAVRRISDNSETGEHCRAAAEFVCRQITRIISIAVGEARQPAPLEHMIATHGALLWLDGLRYSTSWLPSPYEPQQIIETILAERRRVPTLGEGIDSKLFDETVRLHIVAGSFIPARLLVSSSSAYGIVDSDREHAAAYIDAQAGAAKEDVRRSLEKVRRALENIARTAETIAEQEQAATQITKIEIVNLDQLPPQEANLEALSEEETPDLIRDISSVRALVADMAYRTRQIRQRKRDALWKTFHAVKEEANATASDLDRISDLINKDDLITAEEFLSYLEKGNPLPSNMAAHRRFYEYFPAVPQEAHEAKNFASEVASSLKTATDLGSLKFSAIPPDRLDYAIRVWTGWQDVRRTVHNIMSAEQVFSMLCHFLGQIGISAEIIQAQKKPANDRKPYTAVLRMTLPSDEMSMLLPDFGSLSNGIYKVMIAGNYPEDYEIAKFMEGSVSEAKVAFILNSVHPNRWRQLAQKSRAASWRLLVIDDTAMAYATSEPEFRPLTPFELAEPFSYATPYKDYGNGRVPPEIFVGRRKEIEEVVNPYGSCVLYGGRRLGKTALLLHIASSHHNPSTSYLCYHVSIEEVGGVGSSAGHLWRRISESMLDIFASKHVASGDEFSLQVKEWLDRRPGGRIILMLDEADKFISKDAEDGFASFKVLQKLMEDSSRRFKIILAGIHNVTRFVRSGNPPIKQIASNPQRIGPLMERELADAERLVTKSLASLGFEFESRELVWRILSRTNYYPILVHVFCDKLLERLRQRAVNLRTEPPFIITSDLVDDALNDAGVDDAIKEKIDVTLNVDERYVVLAYVIANRMLSEASEGRMAEGISTVIIREDAAYFWPAAFSGMDGLSIIEDLLDEMEGLGILLKTTRDRWILRSPSIRKLLGDKDRISTVLLQYSEANPPSSMDLRNLHRYVAAEGGAEGTEYVAPLTMGQEHDLVSGKSKVTIIFGNQLSGISLVAPSLSSVLTETGDTARVSIRVVKRIESLMTEVSSMTISRGWTRLFLVLSPDCPWNADWVKDVLTLRQVRSGDVHVVFVGGPEHAYSWFKDARSREAGSHIRIMPLQPWSDAMVREAMGRLNISLTSDLRRKLLASTGGYSQLMSRVMIEMKTSSSRERKLDVWVKRNIAEPDLATSLGIVSDIAAAVSSLAVWKDMSMTQDDIHDEVTSKSKCGLTAEEFIQYGETMHLLLPAPEKHPQDRFVRKWVASPVLAENHTLVGARA